MFFVHFIPRNINCGYSKTHEYPRFFTVRPCRNFMSICEYQTWVFCLKKNHVLKSGYFWTLWNPHLEGAWKGEVICLFCSGSPTAGLTPFSMKQKVRQRTVRTSYGTVLWVYYWYKGLSNAQVEHKQIWMDWFGRVFWTLFVSLDQVIEARFGQNLSMCLGKGYCTYNEIWVWDLDELIFI